MEFLDEWLILVIIFTMTVLSPGPDLVMAIRNSIAYSRKSGIFTALGFGLGVSVHAFYSIIGIAAIIAKSTLAFTVIKYIGAAYLFYIGFKALRSKGFNEPNEGAPESQTPSNTLSPFASLRCGFITNLFNPKATLFFLAIFTQILGPETPLSIQILFGGTCVIMVISWFSIVALILTNSRVKARFFKISRWIDRIAGGLMIGLGIKLVLSKA